jgi:hypothetical protein
VYVTLVRKKADHNIFAVVVTFGNQSETTRCGMFGIEEKISKVKINGVESLAGQY